MSIELSTKLDYLKSVFTDPALAAPAYEDAAGHLCDLLELCRRNIRTSDGRMFANLSGMVANYGSGPIDDIIVPASPRVMSDPPADEPPPDLMACDHLKAELAKMPPGARMQLVMGNDPPDNLAIELCAYGPTDDKFSLVVAIIDLEDDDESHEDDEDEED